MIKCKIFTENNSGPMRLESDINEFFEDMEDVMIHSTNMVVEKVDGIDYLSVIVFYH